MTEVTNGYFTGAQIIDRIHELEGLIEKAWETFELDAEAFHAAVDEGLELPDASWHPQLRLAALMAERRELAKRLREMEGRR